jgi:hypothetical protein
MAATGIKEIEDILPLKVSGIDRGRRLLLMALEMKKIAENSCYFKTNEITKEKEKVYFKLKIGLHRG